jgi:hypothetical protein
LIVFNYSALLFENKYFKNTVCRDRYGFKRKFDIISREEYESFDEYYYEVICDRRRKKWNMFLRQYQIQQEQVQRQKNRVLGTTTPTLSVDDSVPTTSTASSTSIPPADILQLPPRSRKLKRLIRKGVPHSLRFRVWFTYSGASKLMDTNPGLYDLLGFREEMDRKMGYTSANNDVLGFIENLDKGESNQSCSFYNVNFVRPAKNFS